MKKIIFVLTLILASFTEGVTQCTCTNCGCTDSLELVKLYNSTGGANWRNKWVLTQPVTTWFGVTLVSGRVTKVLLSNNLLSGSLPNINLPNLTTLYLQANLLSGSIPQLNLPNLTILYLQVNQLTGSIPQFNLPNLERLWLHTNQLTDTVPNFKLPNLQEILLYGNQLSGKIPNFNLPNLKRIWLFTNKLSGQVPNFNLPNLEDIFFAENQLTDTIPNFKLPNLVNLSLNSNQISGNIPNFNFPKLEFIDLSKNQLSGKIPNFNLPLLQSLRLQDNQLSGCIPKEIKTRCPLITETGGSLSNNANLTTQSWANYWNNGEGTCLPSAVQTVSTTIDWRIYPNPAHDNLIVEGLPDQSKITIYNIVGSIVLTTQLKDSWLDIHSLNQGIYTMRIDTGSGAATRLFVKE